MTAGSRNMGKLFQEAGHGTGGHSSCSSEASPAGQNQTDSTRGVLSLFRSKRKGGKVWCLGCLCHWLCGRGQPQCYKATPASSSHV